MESTSKTLGGMARTLPYTAPQAALMAALLTRDPKWAVVAGAMAGNDLVNLAIRKAVGALELESADVAPYGLAENCAMFPDMSYGGPAMPSRYAQLLSFAAAYAVVHILDREKRDVIKWSLSGAIVATTFVALAARGFYQCSTGPQVTVGTVAGVGLGILSYYAINVWPRTKNHNWLLPRPQDEERYLERPTQSGYDNLTLPFGFHIDGTQV